MRQSGLIVFGLLTDVNQEIVFVLLTDVNHEAEEPNCFRFTDGYQI